jgi:hypothetical protein
MARISREDVRRMQSSRDATTGVDVRPEVSEDFRAGLIARGEASRRVDGELPDEATHEIVEGEPGQPPKVIRRRYSAV